MVSFKDVLPGGPNLTISNDVVDGLAMARYVHGDSIKDAEQCNSVLAVAMKIKVDIRWPLPTWYTTMGQEVVLS